MNAPTLTSIAPAPSSAVAWCEHRGGHVGVRVEALAPNPEDSSPPVLHIAPANGAQTSVVLEELDEYVGTTLDGVPPGVDARAVVLGALPLASMNSVGGLMLDDDAIDKLLRCVADNVSGDIPSPGDVLAPLRPDTRAKLRQVAIVLADAGHAPDDIKVNGRDIVCGSRRVGLPTERCARRLALHMQVAMIDVLARADVAALMKAAGL